MAAGVSPVAAKAASSAESWQQLLLNSEQRVGFLTMLEELSFAKTGAALLPVTIATSRDLIAPLITMIGRPGRSDGTYVRARQQL